MKSCKNIQVPKWFFREFLLLLNLGVSGLDHTIPLTKRERAAVKFADKLSHLIK